MIIKKNIGYRLEIPGFTKPGRVALPSPYVSTGLDLESFWHAGERCAGCSGQNKTNFMDPEGFVVRKATKADAKYASQIAEETERSTIARGSGISKRSPESIAAKMAEDKAVIAVTATGEWAGFAYFEVWAGGAFLSNSGLIVSPPFRNCGVAKAIKRRVFSLGRKQYPDAKIFSITTGLAIMKMNAGLGFEPVTYAQLPQESGFWQDCKSCVNYGILENKGCRNCLCTAMLFAPKAKRRRQAAAA